MPVNTPSRLESRVVRAAEAALAERRYVTPIDILMGVGWIHPRNVDAWRQGRIEYLEQIVGAGPGALPAALEVLGRWAREHGLEPSEAAYVARTPSRRPLRFSESGEESLERAYRTHWVSPALSEADRARLDERQRKAPDLVVISPTRDWSCSSCGGTGDFLIMDDGGPLCMTCADLDHLVFLPAGDAALTRRARRASGLSAVVVRFSRARHRYERQGILVEKAAIDRVEPL